jgi:pilus assembly protein Flp/PilA
MALRLSLSGLTQRGDINMKKTWRLFATLVREESGQDLIEYALIAALLALAAVGTMQTLGSKISNEFNSIGTSL